MLANQMVKICPDHTISIFFTFTLHLPYFLFLSQFAARVAGVAVIDPSPLLSVSMTLNGKLH